MGNSSLSTITENVKQKARNYLQFETKTDLIDFEDESEEILIFGFIRNIEKSFTNDTFIPLSLIDLCFKYYQEYHPNIFILTGTIKENVNQDLNKMHCINLNNKRKYVFNIYDILQNEGYRNKKQIISNNKHWDSWYANISFCRKFKLPTYIERLYLKNIGYDHDKYSVLFKCGGGHNNNYNASVIIFNEKSLSTYKYEENIDMGVAEIDGFEYKLPSLNVNKICRTIWSFEHQSLFSMSSDGIISQLPLVNEFEWKQLPNAIINNRSIELMTILSPHGQLCVLSHNAVQKYDFHENKWSKISNGFVNNSFFSSMATPTMASLLYSGIFYDTIQENIYIGGGLEEYTQRYFNLNKLKWYNLSDTNYKHSQFPILWSSKNQPFLLFIAGNNDQDIGVVECCDLRANVTKWMNANHNQME